MASEVWFRNPERWMNTLVDAGANKVVWHRGLLINRRIDPVAHARLHFPVGVPWRVMSVGAQGGVEWDQDSPNRHSPRACYPIWQYGEPLDLLEELCTKNVAEDPEARTDPDMDREYLPQEGQEHRVIIGSYPSLHTGPGRRLMVLLGELQADHPDCIIHLFSATTFRPVFSVGSGDVDVWTTAARGRAMLPNGKIVERDKLAGHRQWVNLLGFSPADLHDKFAMLHFNIHSALYASEHWGTPENFSSGPREPQGRRKVYRGSPAPGDKVSCDHCTLADSCKHYREGSVCSLPSSETVNLAHFFKTRDSDRIIEGLGELLATQGRRAESALEVEAEAGELDPEVTKVLGQMFDGGVKLAKLVNPTLAAAGAAKIGIQVNAPGGNAVVSAANPAALMGALVRELEARGIPRDEITPEMVVGLVDKPEAIEAKSTEVT